MIGITERGDAALDLGWKQWVQAGKPAILITKSPVTLEHFLSGRENIIIHCTITGMGCSKYEPGVQPWTHEIKGYHNLVAKFGHERVVLRVDPIIPNDAGIARAVEVAKQRVVGDRLRISFLDMYNHVQNRFRDAQLPIPHTTTHATLERRRRAFRAIAATMADEPNKELQVEVCGEPNFACTGCVSIIDCVTLGVTPKPGMRGQRAACPCLMEKTELLSRKGRCSFQCLYCYWQDS